VALEHGLDVRRLLGRELFVQVHACGSPLDQRDRPVVPRASAGEVKAMVRMGKIQRKNSSTDSPASRMIACNVPRRIVPDDWERWCADASPGCTRSRGSTFGSAIKLKAGLANPCNHLTIGK
jgi:hypothetical protein